MKQCGMRESRVGWLASFRNPTHWRGKCWVTKSRNPTVCFIDFLKTRNDDRLQPRVGSAFPPTISCKWWANDKTICLLYKFTWFLTLIIKIRY
jgi:hypothetical protein